MLTLGNECKCGDVIGSRGMPQIIQRDASIKSRRKVQELFPSSRNSIQLSIWFEEPLIWEDELWSLSYEFRPDREARQGQLEESRCPAEACPPQLKMSALLSQGTIARY